LDGVGRVQIINILKGNPESKTPLISLRKPVASDATDQVLAVDSFPKGRKFVLFLKDIRLHGEEFDRTSLNSEAVNFVAFDPWLSCMPYSRSLELELEPSAR
jgi:hypothetical protein